MATKFDKEYLKAYVELCLVYINLFTVCCGAVIIYIWDFEWVVCLVYVVPY